MDTDSSTSYKNGVKLSKTTSEIFYEGHLYILSTWISRYRVVVVVNLNKIKQFDKYYK